MEIFFTKLGRRIFSESDVSAGSFALIHYTPAPNKITLGIQKLSLGRFFKLDMANIVEVRKNDCITLEECQNIIKDYEIKENEKKKIKHLYLSWKYSNGFLFLPRCFIFAKLKWNNLCIR